MDKEQIVKQLELLGDAFGGKYTVGTIPIYIYENMTEIVNALKEYKKENPVDVTTYDKLVLMTIICFKAIFEQWVKECENSPQILTIRIDDLVVGNCFLDIWIETANKIQGLHLNEESQMAINTLSSEMKQLHKDSNGGNEGCLSAFITIIVISTLFLSFISFGLYHLLA